MLNRLLIMVLLPMTLYAQVTIGGGKGLLRVYEADAIEYGKLYVNSVFQGYATKTDNNYTLSELYTLHLGFSLGLGCFSEVFIHLIPYHDDQKHIFGPPGDTQIGLKYTFVRPAPFLAVAAVAYTELSTATTHPIPFEPYSERGLGWAFITSTSFNFRETSLAWPVKWSLNFGYKDHNVNNDVFAGITDQLIGGFGVKYAINKALFYNELSGEFFFNRNDVKLMENSVRFTQGVKFYGPYEILFNLAADIDLSDAKRRPEQNQSARFYEDYADWRIMVGATYSFNFFENNNTELEQRQIEQKNINEIRRQRQDINKELEEYRKRLEKEKKKDVPF